MIRVRRLLNHLYRSYRFSTTHLRTLASWSGAAGPSTLSFARNRGGLHRLDRSFLSVALSRRHPQRIAHERMPFPSLVRGPFSAPVYCSPNRDHSIYPQQEGNLLIDGKRTVVIFEYISDH